MALFNQSSKTCSDVVDEITDAVGASADTEMRVRANRSLNAAIGHFNTRAKWDFLLTEADPITIYAPFSVGGVSASAGQASAACPVGHGLVVDDLISFSGLGLGTRVSATAAGGFGMSTTPGAGLGTGTVTVTASVVRDMYALPSAWKSPYSVKTLNQQVALLPIRRRLLNRSSTQEFTPSTPVAYDVYPITTKGKIKLVPPPGTADILQLNYYRRITPSPTPSSGQTLDVPQDVEPYLTAYAKWHFILDKGEGRSAQGSTWLAFAEGGLKTMLAEQTSLADEDLAFVAGHGSFNLGGANSTRNIPWDY